MTSNVNVLVNIILCLAQRTIYKGFKGKYVIEELRILRIHTLARQNPSIAGLKIYRINNFVFNKILYISTTNCSQKNTRVSQIKNGIASQIEALFFGAHGIIVIYLVLFMKKNLLKR